MPCGRVKRMLTLQRDKPLNSKKSEPVLSTTPKLHLIVRLQFWKSQEWGILFVAIPLYTSYHHQIALRAWISLSLSLSIHPYHPLLPAGPPNFIQYAHRTDVSSCWSAGPPNFIQYPHRTDVSSCWSAGPPNYIQYPHRTDVSSCWSAGLPNYIQCPHRTDVSSCWSAGPPNFI